MHESLFPAASWIWGIILTAAHYAGLFMAWLIVFIIGFIIWMILGGWLYAAGVGSLSREVSHIKRSLEENWGAKPPYYTRWEMKKFWIGTAIMLIFSIVPWGLIHNMRTMAPGSEAALWEAVGAFFGTFWLIYTGITFLVAMCHFLRLHLAIRKDHKAKLAKVELPPA